MSEVVTDISVHSYRWYLESPEKNLMRKKVQAVDVGSTQQRHNEGFRLHTDERQIYVTVINNFSLGNEQQMVILCDTDRFYRLHCKRHHASTKSILTSRIGVANKE